jgi:hypothetical protein
MEVCQDTSNEKRGDQDVRPDAALSQSGVISIHPACMESQPPLPRPSPNLGEGAPDCLNGS